MRQMAKVVTGDRVGRLGRLRIGCCVVVRDASCRRILLMKRDDNGLWCLPSGGVEPGESATEAAEREAREETGLIVRVTGMIGLYSSPHVLVEYADGNRFQIVSACFEATVVGGELAATREAVEFGYFVPDELTRLDVMPNHVERIEDAFAFAGTTFVR
jgi:ADP-ribose pyrophosphatase YjhB (NUDIX family)